MSLTLPSKRQPEGWNYLKPLGGKLLRGIMLLGALVSADAAKAQLTGIKTIPGDYATVTAAVTALNTSGVGAGGVTFELAAGTTFTETIPVITATGTATDSIVFKRSAAAGANPKIVPLTAGTVSTSTTVASNGDAIITINGGDYIVFDGIDLQTNASFTTSATRMEYGYILKKASATNACKNVTIRNCTITLDKVAAYSFGIYVSNFTGTALTVPTSTGGRAENIKIFNNTISNAYGGVIVKGYAHTSAPYDLLDQNIQIGMDGGNTINNFGGSTNDIYGIYSIYVNNLVVANNTLNNTANGGAASNADIYGIYASTAANANATFDNNTLTLAHTGTTKLMYGLYINTGAGGTNNLLSIHHNTVTGCTAPSLTSGDFWGIFQGTTPYQAHIYNNNVINNTLAAGSTAVFYGIYNSGAVVNQTNIYNNIISGNSKVGTGVMYCIYNSPAATCTSNIYNNTISGNNSNNGTNHGLYLNASLLLNAYKNNIFGLTATGSGGDVYGISVASGPITTNIYNNFIAQLTAPTASSTADAVRGISLATATASTNVNVFNNTIYLNASSTGTDFNTSGIYQTSNGIATTAFLTMRNNNVVNVSTPSGTGITAAFKRSSAPLFTYNRISGNNNFYAGVPAANRVIYSDGINSDQTLAGYRDRVSPADQGSVSELPPFVNVAIAPYNLHITPGVATQLESAGITIATPAITDDIDGNARGTTPDIGADEFAGLLSDVTAPAVLYTPLSFSCAATDRTITATITDATGAPVSGTLVPRIYFMKNSGTWISQPGTLTTGTGTNGTWDFTIPAASLGGLAFGDIVSYYIIAQDNAASPTVATVPSGGIASNVNTVTTTPASPNRFGVGTVLSGTYTINAGAPASGSNFQNFTYAAASLSCGISGPVTFNVVSGSGPYNEQMVIESVPGSSATNTITFNGNGNAISYLSTNANERAVIRLDNADFVTINNFIINPMGTTSTEYGFGVHMVNDADNNTINNCTINISTAAITAANYGGIVMSAIKTPTSSVVASDNKCDNNTFTGNTINGGYVSISMVGSSVFNMSNNIVSNNTIKDFYAYGIYANGHINLQVQNNDVSRPTHPSPSTFYGIYLATYATNAIINGNRLHHPFGGNPTDAGTAYGLYCTATGTVAAPNTFSNNILYKMDGEGTHYNMYMGGDNTKLYHNTLSSNESSATTSGTSTYGIYLAATNVDIKNNVISITRGGTGVKYGIYRSSSTGLLANKNLYYVNGGGTNNVGYWTTAQATLANWQTASTQDATSPAPADPMFTASATGNLLPTNLTLDNLGTPVGILTDIQSTARSITAPDLGAFEFGVYPLDVNVLSFTARKAGRDVNTAWTVGVEDNMSAYVVERSSDGKGFTEVGQVKAAGLSNYSFNDAEAVAHATGSKLYYRLRTIETTGKMAYSKIAVVNLDAADDIFSVYPNPFAASVTIRATATQSGTCIVVIRDLNGRTVATQSSAIEAGTNYIEVSGLGKLAHGAYHVIANFNGKTEAATITK